MPLQTGLLDCPSGKHSSSLGYTEQGNQSPCLLLLCLEGSVTMKAELIPWNLPLSPPGHCFYFFYLTNPQPGKQKCFL